MAGITIRDIAIAFGYDVDEKSEAKANESVKALKDTATKALAAIGIGFSLSQVFSAVKSLEAVQEAVTDVKKDWAALGKELDETFGLTKMIVGGIKKVSAAGIDAVRRIGPRLSGIVKSLGGMRNVLKLVAIVGGAIFAAMNLSKITSGLKGIVGLLKSIKLSTLAIVAVFILLALLVEDFIVFMQGKNSMIGSILQQAGIDCDALRDKVRATWDNIKKVFLTVGGAIRNVVAALFAAIRQFWDQNGEAIKKKVADAVVSMVDKLNSLSEWMVKNRDTIVKVTGKVLALVVAFFTVKGAITKLLGVFKTATGVAGKLGKVFADGGGIVKTLGSIFKSLVSPVGVAAVAIVAIAAIAYDFFRFMSGQDSVIGKILGKIGVDCDGLRQKITDAWTKVRQFLLMVWNAIQSVCVSVWGNIQGFFAEYSNKVKNGLVSAWTAIKTILLGVWDTIKVVATAVFDALKTFWSTWGNTIITCFSGVWEAIKAVFGAALDVLADLFAIFSDLFSGNWSQLWEDVKTLISDVWNGIVNIVTTILNTMKDVIFSVFNTIQKDITTSVGSIKDSIVDGFQAAINWITGLPAQALRWGADLITGIADGIKGAVGKVTDAVKGVADKIKSFLHFSVPDEGPLTDYQNWMPDFMGGLAAGIEQNKGSVLSAIKNLATDMSALSQSAQPSPATVQHAAANNSSVSKSVIQNVEINQEFHGDAAAQKNIAKAADSAADDTTGALARALAYT